MKSNWLLYVWPAGAKPSVPPALEAELAAEDLHIKWTGRNARLWGLADAGLYPLADDRGWLLGHVFEKTDGSAGRHSGLDAESVFSGDVTEAVWGSYVAIAERETGVVLLRDPSGGMPCYRASRGCDHFFTSTPDLFVRAGLIRPSIDWSEVGQSIVHRDRRASATALHNVREVLPGTTLEMNSGGERERRVWDAARFADRTDAGDPAVVLEQALSLSLRAWGRSCHRPLVEISGGLDSAIVAAGIAAVSPDAMFVTFAAAPGDPDETIYAHAIAEHLDRRLEIVQPRIEDVDLTCSLSGGLPRPNARAFTQAADLQSLRLAKLLGADVFFSGGGGDDVFCYLRSVLPAIDRLRAEGLGAMLRTAIDIAYMNHGTIWEALSRLVRHAIRLRLPPSQGDTRFVSPVYAATLADTAITAASRELPPGKARHIEGIMTIHNYLEGHRRAEHAPLISPLLSQPVVEACLAIPSWRWCRGGRNRAVAREAACGTLPELVLERRSKGAFDGFCAMLLHRNLSLIEAMLIDGELAAQGIIDRASLIAALRAASPPAATVSRVLYLVDVEAWLRSWRWQAPH